MFAHPAEWLLTLTLGAGLGFFGGLFGIGGGIIAIPLFALVFDMPQALAQGTALVMMVPNLLMGWWRYQQRHPGDRRQALAIAVASALTTALLAHWATRAPPLLLRSLFSIFLIVLALRLLRPQRVKAHDSAAKLGPRWLPLVGVLGGSSMGLLGIGGGLVATPLLTSLFGLRQTLAQSLALALVTPSAVIALLSYARAGQVNWQMGLPMAVAGLCTVSAGVALAHKLPDARLKRSFAWLLLLCGLWLLFGIVRG